MAVVQPEPEQVFAETFIQPRDRINDRQCAAIGRVGATWSLLELLIERMLARLSMAPSLMGHLLSDRLGPDNRISALESLLRVHHQKYGDEFVSVETRIAIKSLLSKIKRMKDDRNYIVHSVWTAASLTLPNLMSRIDIGGAARSGIDIHSQHAEDVTSIEQFAATVQAACDRLHVLTNQIPEIDATWLDKLQKREQHSRRSPLPESARVSPHRSYTQL